MRSWVVTLCLMFPVIQEARAVRQYRCDGRVQYRPCTEMPSVSRASFKKRITVRKDRFANVLESSFAKADKGLGLWKGVVEGNGTVELALQIFRRGNLESTRYMGNVPLKGRSTTFRFKAPLPHGKEWSWKVVAWAT